MLDLANDKKEKEDDPQSIILSYNEKYKSGKMITNRNEFLINKSRSYMYCGG